MNNEITETRKMVVLKEWMSIIQECKASGMTNKDWCRMNGISLSKFYRRQTQVREYLLSLKEDKEQPDLVQIQNPCKSNKPEFLSSGTPVLVIRKDDLVIEVYDSLNPDFFQALVSVL